MYKINGKITYSPTDLMVFMNSPFSSWMARLSVDHPERLKGIENDRDEMMDLLANKGNEHELLFLGEMKQQFGPDNVAILILL